jgi:xanthine dehydrogenase accessory factor
VSEGGERWGADRGRWPERANPACYHLSVVSELFEHIGRLRDAAGKVAVATLVNTRGTTPRKEGARMVVDDRGRILGSVTIGGCVDAQVIEESSDVLDAMRPRLLELNLGDEEAWEIGLTCGGTIEVFVEPLDDRPDGALSYYERIRAHTQAGGRAALVSRLDDAKDGKLLVLDDGRVEGTLGEPFLDDRFAAEAREALRRETSRTLLLEGIRAFVEVFAPPALLLVVGAGHVAMPLTSLGRLLGYRTAVLDGRPRFATKERFPQVDELKIGIPSELVRGYPLIPSTALVLVAHDYKYDLPVLRHAVTTAVGYIGMLGSTRRATAILKLLVEDGVAPDLLARVRVPIGLDLGARSAPEIALAILAEIQAARGGGTGRPLSEVLRERDGGAKSPFRGIDRTKRGTDRSATARSATASEQATGGEQGSGDQQRTGSQR